MSLIASGRKTILDISDGRALSLSLNCNQPTMQLYDAISGGFSPDWTDNPVTLTPVVYLGDTLISNGSLTSYSWTKKEGNGLAGNITSATPALTISSNALSSSVSTVTYTLTVTYNDTNMGSTLTASDSVTFHLIKSGAAICSAEVYGDQMLVIEDGTAKSAGLVLSTQLLHTEVSEWQYLQSNGSYAKIPGSGTADVLTVAANSAIWQGSDTVTVRLVAKNEADETDLYYDYITLYKIETSGATPMVYLTNENVTFSADSYGAVAACTVTSDVIAYTGAKRVTPVVNVSGITGVPAGMTVTTAASGDDVRITLAVADGATFGTVDEVQGSIVLPVTSPVDVKLSLNWSKVKSGSSGTSAVTFSVYAPNGQVFTGNETDHKLPLYAQGYDGTTTIQPSDADWQWSHYSGGNFVNIAGATSSTYEVAADDVQTLGVYRCQMTYPKGSGLTYVDTITVQDRTDAGQAYIESTMGTILRTSQEGTFLFCRVWKNGEELDVLKSTTMTKATDVTGTLGSFYYKGTDNYPSVALMRYNGVYWQQVQDSDGYAHTLRYRWYLVNIDGESSSGTYTEGKVVYLPVNMFTKHITLMCDVLESGQLIASAQFTVSTPYGDANWSNGENLLSGTSRESRSALISSGQGYWFFPDEEADDDETRPYLHWTVDRDRIGDPVSLRCYLDLTDAADDWCIGFVTASDFTPARLDEGRLDAILLDVETDSLFGGQEGVVVSAGMAGFSELITVVPSTAFIIYPVLFNKTGNGSDPQLSYHSLKLEYGDMPSAWTDIVDDNYKELEPIVRRSAAILEILQGNNGADETISPEDSARIVASITNTVTQESGIDTMQTTLSNVTNVLTMSLGGISSEYSKEEQDVGKFQTWLRYNAEEGALYIGKKDERTSDDETAASNDYFQTKITDSSMEFQQNGNTVASINNQMLNISQAWANNYFRIGNLQAEVEDGTGSITWKWVE